MLGLNSLPNPGHQLASLYDWSISLGWMLTCQAGFGRLTAQGHHFLMHELTGNPTYGLHTACRAHTLAVPVPALCQFPHAGPPSSRWWAAVSTETSVYLPLTTASVTLLGVLMISAGHNTMRRALTAVRKVWLLFTKGCGGYFVVVTGTQHSQPAW